MVNATSSQNPARMNALFALGFRPFFLLAGISGVVLMALWGHLFNQGGWGDSYYPPVYWHAHEMIWGFAVAVVAGFLLTAVRNWTGRHTVSGRPLAVLTLVWLLPRLLPLLGGAVPGWLIALLDIAFLPLVAFYIGRPIWQARLYRNLMFIPILLVLALVNLLFHLGLMNIIEWPPREALYLAVDLIVLVIAIIGGRVIPFFTERGCPEATVSRTPRLDPFALLGLVLLLVVERLGLPGWLVALLALVVTGLHAIRLWNWFSRPVLGVPLLWILHLAYAFLVLGLLLKAFSALHWVTPQVSVHALTVGSIGGMILGMMARVSLGHTGRPLRASRMMIAAFALVLLAALIRVVLIALIPQAYSLWITLSALCWVLAFGLFVVQYTPVLLKPRPDGKPG